MQNIYYISGADGSGKTTHIKYLREYFEGKGYKISCLWIRSPKIFSKPLMALCRIVGLTKYFYKDGLRYGRHEFYRSKAVSWLFPILQLIDFKIMWFIYQNKNKQEQILLLDRFSLDTLVDLIVDTHRFKLHKTWIGRKFINTIPSNTKIIILKVNESLIRNRKKDTRYDSQLSNKLKIYTTLANDLNIKIIDNNRNLEIVRREISNHFQLN